MQFPVYNLARFYLNSEDGFPGPRCGHTFTAVGHHLMLFGGCTSVASVGGGRPSLSGMTNSVHCFDAVYDTWSRIYPFGEIPCPRAGHGAAAFGSTLFILGGVSAAGMCTGDLYTLELTSDNSYLWRREVVQGEGPGPRFGHAMGSAGQKLIIFGGKNGDVLLSDTWALDMTQRPYTWERLNSHGNMPSARMYASGCGRSDGIFMLCGGRDHKGESLKDAYGLIMHHGESVWILFPDIPSYPRQQHAAVFEGSRLHITGGALKRSPQFDGEAAVAVLDTDNGLWMERAGPVASNHSMLRYRHAAASYGNKVYMYGGSTEDDRLLNDFWVAGTSSNEGVYASLPTLEEAFYSVGTEVFESDNLRKMVITKLLRPQDWTPPASRKFFLKYNQIAVLCQAARDIIAQEPTVLQLDIPIKVFGDIHGQFGDLMQLFKKFGCPSIDGDITYIDYLFLGDYVDRGAHNLETILLLLALKVEYPRNIHLIRGNHESRPMNAAFGFLQECIDRMGPCEGVKAWLDINNIFDHLPLSALIGKRIFCMHGGLGRSVDSVEQIASIPRPIALETDESSVVKDLLWSDPTENDQVLGIQPNSRGSHLCCFGPDIVWDFCKRNNIDLILRGHQCVKDGIQRFAGGKLITVFSATNYCGGGQNAGAVLIIDREFGIIAKVIYPPPLKDSKNATIQFEEGSTSNAN